MSTNAVNGRDDLLATLFQGGGFLSSTGAAPSPTTHTMVSPVFATLPDPGIHTQPGPPTTPSLPPYIPEIDGDYFDDQWHFDFIGDIDTIWEEYTGGGVHVGVYDDGLKSIHADLAGNYDASLQVTVNGVVIDPNFAATNIGFPHGTAVAGLIAAGNNGFGTTGVAYGASLTGVTVFSGAADINSNYAGFIEAISQADSFDVVNNSWGRFPGFWQDPEAKSQSQQLTDAWLDVAETGRDGLGTVIVKAAGNDDRNANGDEGSVSRVSIIVGAYDDDGDASYYSSFGSNLLISAPSSGDGMNNRDLVTTDIGPFGAGYNIWSETGELLEENYTNAFGGTSGATPIVTGVIALMLEANPDLGWRDVQNIIAYSAHEIGSGVGGTRTESEDHDWRYNNAGNWNGGGLHYSEDYGFGSINAYNAVRMAEVWTLLGEAQANANETSYSSTATNVALADLTTTDIQFTFDGSSFDVESVSITLDISHTSQSEEVSFVVSGFAFVEAQILPAFLTDLDITLISPDGTETPLADFDRDLAIEYGENGWTATFNANAFRGEDGTGTWTLRINDPWVGDEGMVNSATVTLHGRDGDQVDLGADVYHYTSEVFETLSRDASRQTLTDGDGGVDWLDMATMADDLVVNLAAGATSTAGGTAFLTIAAGTDIENAVTGDGDDQITGNGLANALYGMRGDDTISGGAGNDKLSGGAGNDRLSGGLDADIFLFDRALDETTNVDVIVDFSHLDDVIWLDATIFDGLSLGTLDADLFYVIGSGAEGTEDRILFDAGLGALYFDIDGAGGEDAVQFASFEAIPLDLSFDDFVVFSDASAPLTEVTDRTASTDPTVVTTAVTDPLGDGTPIVGTDGDDTIRGKDADDHIEGGGGVDAIYSGAGNDYIDGGAETDLIVAGEGDDTVVGGGSFREYGDWIEGREGNDTLTGSEQENDFTWRFLGYRGDLIDGGEGDDTIYGLSGDDMLVGGVGNDVIYGGEGSDRLIGGEGDDRIYAGVGRNLVVGEGGHDTVVFEGNIEEYRFFFAGTQFSTSSAGLWIERIGSSGEQRELTNIDWRNTETLEFADQSFSIDPNTNPIIIQQFGPSFGSDRPAVELETDGTIIAAQVDGASTISITDTGAEDGGIDRLQALAIGHVLGDVDIRSDAVTHLSLNTLGFTGFDPDTFQFIYQPYDGKLEVYAAEGERNLDIDFNIADLGPTGLVVDRTATSVALSSNSTFPSHLNGADATGYNLAFDSATSIRFRDMNDAEIKWYIPNVTTIEIYFEQFDDVTQTTSLGNGGTVLIETALDDSIFATAGGSAEYRFLADIETFDELDGQVFTSNGVERIRFGNLGKVNASNDGTTGEDALMNEGLGLRGEIRLGAGSDEVRILGSSAFKGGTVDAGTGDGISFEAGEADVLRMTFGVADAIGNISKNISNFEVLQLDTPTQEPVQEPASQSQSHGRHGWGWHTPKPPKPSVKENVADMRDFDNLDRIDITGSAAESGKSAVTNLVNGSTVTLRTVGEAKLIQNVANEIFSTYDKYGNNFGRIRLDMAGSGRHDILTLAFVGLLTDGLDTGIITVADAETVHITTDARDQDIFEWNPEIFFFDPLSFDPTDPFGQALALEKTKTVVLSGETGWDFTVEGSDISEVTSLDASGVLGTGAIGGVTAVASARNVTFTGGWGDDALTGAKGNDTLIGGDGNDTLRGGDGNDLLDGGTGADDMAGGRGNDTYIVDDAGDTVTEYHRQGTDTVKSSINYGLGDHVENLTLTGAASEGTGNSLDNKIVGNDVGNVLKGLDGDDKIYGGAGADTIEGGSGKDWLFGGLGEDAFVFNTALSSRSNRDAIADYNVDDDVIHLDNAVFTALLGEEGSVLSAEQFYLGSRAHDADDRIVYNARTGALIYDDNGSARGGEVEIAVLSRHLALTNDDFVIV